MYGPKYLRREALYTSVPLQRSRSPGLPSSVETMSRAVETTSIGPKTLANPRRKEKQSEAKLNIGKRRLLRSLRANQSDRREARDSPYQRHGGESVAEAVGEEGKDELPSYPLFCVQDVAFFPLGTQKRLSSLSTLSHPRTLFTAYQTLRTENRCYDISCW